MCKVISNFFFFFVVPLRGHFSIGILTKTKKLKVKCLYFCELQQELYVHNTLFIFNFSAHPTIQILYSFLLLQLHIYSSQVSVQQLTRPASLEKRFYKARLQGFLITWSKHFHCNRHTRYKMSSFFLKKILSFRLNILNDVFF